MMDCVCECKEACCWRFCYFYLKSYALCELGTSIIKRLAANQDELQESVPVALPLVIYKALEKKDENDLLVNVAKTWTKVWIILSTRMCGALLVHKGVQYLKQVPRATARASTLHPQQDVGPAQQHQQLVLGPAQQHKQRGQDPAQQQHQQRVQHPAD